MSELTRCNYCTYRELQREHGRKNVRTKADALAAWAGGVRVEIRGKDGQWRDGGHWFAELGDSCVC